MLCTVEILLDSASIYYNERSPMAGRPLGTNWFDRDGDFLSYKTANGLDVR